MDFEPFLEAEEEGPLNELLVAVVRARGLAVRDKNLFSKGTPVVTVVVLW